MKLGRFGTENESKDWVVDADLKSYFDTILCTYHETEIDKESFGARSGN